jgi:hypothetical protein
MPTHTTTNPDGGLTPPATGLYHPETAHRASLRGHLRVTGARHGGASRYYGDAS